MVWCDPPSGWKYGFPKLWNIEGNYFEWLVSEGYPQKEIDRMGDQFYSNHWEATEDEIEVFESR